MKMSIDLTIFAEREQKEITYDGKYYLATPIACDDGYFMGVGLGFEDGTARVYSISPRKILTTFRAMKIADLFNEFTDSTLHNCLNTADYCPRVSDDIGKKSFEEIKRRIGEREIERIKQLFPDNIEKILKISRDKWEFDGFEEIEEEIRAGNIQLTPAVESYFMEFQRYKLGK